MSTNAEYPHLAFDDQGRPKIGSTRYKVAHLAAEHFQYGWTPAELVRQHPDPRPEEVYAALTYFYDHHEAMATEMKDSLAEVTANRPDQTLSRDESVCRKCARKNEMAHAFYTDAHVPAAITAGLVRRGVDVLTSQDDGTAESADEALLERATQLGRLLFAQDDDLLSPYRRVT